MNVSNWVVNTSVEAQCELADQLKQHFGYQLSLIYTCVVSLAATFLQIAFLLLTIRTLRFHGNLKYLLQMYFSIGFLLSLDLFLGFALVIYLTCAATSCSELFIEPAFFKIYHISSMFLMTNSMLLPIGFSIERLYALKNAENYEKEKIFLGPILVIILVALDFLFIGLIYFDEEFTGPFISLILVPSTSAFQFNIYFYCLLGVQIFNLICNIFTLVFHSKKHRNSQQKTNTLSFQYVMAEVNDSSMFTLVVSFSHLLFAGFYIICGIFARQFGPTFFNNVVDYTVARAVFCSIPSYNFMIVFIGSLILFQQNKKKASKVASNIALVSIGQEGALNYENVTRNIWDRAVN